MCKHILNAQVAVRSPCCRKWFDCVECHTEQESHPLQESFDMIFACKKCRKCFRKNAKEFEEADEYCPHCDNHYIIEAKTPKPALAIEGDDVRMNSKMLKDDRTKEGAANNKISIFDPNEDASRLG